NQDCFSRTTAANSLRCGCNDGNIKTTKIIQAFAIPLALASTSHGGFFLLSLMTNYGKFLTLQTATHKTHTKLTIAMSSLTPPCHIGGFFRLS
ncbi:hypothetical protein L3W35_RS28800, partial [Escherichia coli]